MPIVKIAGGTVYDPANEINGEVRDVWIDNGRIIPPPGHPGTSPQCDSRTIDASGYVVMPGGIDMHCHIAGPKVNVGRKMMPEAQRAGAAQRRSDVMRSGTMGDSAPSSFVTGYLFSRMGYTTAFDAAVPGLLARHAHEEFQDTPILDKGFYVLFGNNHYVMRHLREGDEPALDAYLAWALGAVKGYTIKLVNPGGIESWKQISRKSLHELEEPVPHFDVSPRQIVHGLAAAADRMKLPHSVHIHCNNLGIPGNWRTTLHTMQSLEGHRGHFAHVQFHSYAGDANDGGSFRSAVPNLAEYVNANPNITVDVGHVMPGRTVIMTADAPSTYNLFKGSGRKWFTGDCEMETSCGVIPIEYRPQRSLIHAVQWAIALEWYLLMDDPWRLAMTSDHPNGGAFWRYPELIHLLMDANLRLETLKRMPAKLTERTQLADIDREYSLYEIAIITRAAPARILGLANKGHLGVGADADLTIYTPSADQREMFARPRWVLKAGEIVVEDGEIRATPLGGTHFVEPSFDLDRLPGIREWFQSCYTIEFENYAVDSSYLAAGT